MSRFFKIWWLLTSLSSQVALRSSFGAILFFVGKILRFGLFIAFILVLESKVKSIAGYSIWQMILFFSTFNLIDVTAQFLLREVYRFRSYIVRGEFDFILIKPLPPLFRSLFGGSDILDLPILILSIILIIISMTKVGDINLTNILLFLLLTINGLIIALAFHIFTLGIGILTTEVDNTIMLYRDLTQMARFPVDIYRQPAQSLLTFVIPVGIMITFPPKALLGLLSPILIIISLTLGVVFLYLSLRLWNFGLKHYQSASS
ncbi:ABC-2 family transporter protein [Candidatus Daviesbacteria bacterium]|nr:ABC-2 family transporter protein [Candidatus Daviesbacteria bacterium]